MSFMLQIVSCISDKGTMEHSSNLRPITLTNRQSGSVTTASSDDSIDYTVYEESANSMRKIEFLHGVGRQTKIPCKLCNKLISHLNMKKHLIIHSGVRNHKCVHCGRAFSQGPDLKRHMVIHSGVKKHKCVHCGRAFSQGQDLKKHMFIVHSES